VKIPLPDLSGLIPVVHENQDTDDVVDENEDTDADCSQVIPLLKSSKEVEVDCYSVYTAQQGIPRSVSVKQHQYDMAFALTDFKLQGRTLPKLIISVCERHRMPWMTLQAFYVLVSRVPCMAGLRLLQYDQVGLDSVRRLKPDKYLYAWEHGYDANGKWSDALAVTALRNINNVRTLQKRAAAENIREQSSSARTQNSPAKHCLTSPQKSPNKRQQVYVCTVCNKTGHRMNNCPSVPKPNTAAIPEPNTAPITQPNYNRRLFGL
jgi:hypothetical protein